VQEMDLDWPFTMVIYIKGIPFEFCIKGNILIFNFHILEPNPDRGFFFSSLERLKFWKKFRKY